VTDYIQITFPDLQPEQKEILIAQLADAGYEGFEETETGLEAFVSKKDYDRQVLEEIVFKYQLHSKEVVIAATNWNHIWESNFQPVIIDDFAAIRADFHQPVTGVKHDVIITPKMSFGTGHHATTCMMIRQMQDIDFTGKTILDFGTGTGILAILAEKQGAKKILAIDNDEISVKNATENISRNNCKRITLNISSVVPAFNNFDIILANINKNIILENLKSLSGLLTTGGVMILSGLLTGDKEEVYKAALYCKLKNQRELTRNNWICLRFSTT
jgi:ribosomal protein L11 methyltransferase